MCFLGSCVESFDLDENPINTESDKHNKDKSLINENPFNPDYDLYVSCLDVEGIFGYLKSKDLGIVVDFAKVPQDWICEKSLSTLLQYSEKRDSCSRLINVLESTFVGVPLKKTECRTIAVYLMRNYLHYPNLEEQQIIDSVKTIVALKDSD